MKKILHIISGLGTGGAETMLVQLTGALQERGFERPVCPWWPSTAPTAPATSFIMR
jgi:hypothetical protein